MSFFTITEKRQSRAHEAYVSARLTPLVVIVSLYNNSRTSFLLSISTLLFNNTHHAVGTGTQESG